MIKYSLVEYGDTAERSTCLVFEVAIKLGMNGLMNGTLNGILNLGPAIERLGRDNILSDDYSTNKAMDQSDNVHWSYVITTSQIVATICMLLQPET